MARKSYNSINREGIGILDAQYFHTANEYEVSDTKYMNGMDKPSGNNFAIPDDKNNH